MAELAKPVAFDQISNAQTKPETLSLAATSRQVLKFCFALLISMTLLTTIAFQASSAAQESAEFPTFDPLIAFARRWDINGDRIFTCDEWKYFTIKVFQQADENQNRILDEDEMGEVMAADGIFFELSLSDFDSNDDGRVDRDEFIGRPNPFFFNYDTDRDCRVTESEEKAARK